MGIGYSLPGAAMTQYPGYVFDSNASWSGYGVNGLTNSTQEIRRHLAGEAESKSIYGNIFFLFYSMNLFWSANRKMIFSH